MFINFTQALILGLSCFSSLSVWVLLHLPDPALTWRVEFYHDNTTQLEDDELYTISPAHNWRGLA